MYNVSVNMKCIGLIIACTLLLVSTNLMTGQAGLNPYVGISNAKNADALITPANTSHPGYLIGVDARLNSGGMYFVIGGQFHNIEFLATDEKSFLTVSNKMNWLKLRFGLGFNVVTLNPKVAIRLKSLGSLNLITSHSDDLKNGPYDSFNSGTAGLVLGAGLDVHGITVDLEFEKGFFNAVNMVSGTTYNFLTMTVGFVF